MDFSLIIRTPLESKRNLLEAQRFIRVAVEQGHSIRQCFFQADAVLSVTGNNPDICWQSLASLTNAELLLCSQAVETFDVAVEAPFRVGGLGALVEAAVRADRVVTFV